MTPGPDNLVARLARFSIARKVTLLVGFLSIVAVGLISASRLPLEMSPRGLEGHYMSIHVRWNVGVPPETMEKIGLPLEEELSTVAGVESMTTWGYKWGARVELRFRHGTDMDVAYREVRDRTERARARFPEGTEKPYLYKHEPGAEPVVSFRISYDPESDYYDLIQKHVITPIQRIDGVADIDFRIYQREIRIEVDRDRAEAHGMPIQEVARILRDDNFTLASGWVTDGGLKFTLKSASEFRSMHAIGDIPLRPDLYLRDIARIVYEPEEAERLYRYNAQPANGISVKREGEANTVEVSRRVVGVIDEIRRNPAMRGFDLSVYDNQGEEIIGRLRALVENGRLGAVLAALVLLFFLRQFRMTAVISLAIPLCLLVALTAMHFAGQTLNGLTIMGLVICVGLLVDNSVVVAENIHRHHAAGVPRAEACVRGVAEIGFAITIATATTLIVFGSAMLLSGELRVVIGNMALPVVVAISASLVVAVLFIPLAVHLTLPRSAAAPSGHLAPVGRAFQRAYETTFGRVHRGYLRVLGFFLHRRLDLALLLVALLAGSWWLSGGLNRTRRTEEAVRYFSIDVRFPEKFSMDERLDYFLKVEDLMERNRDLYVLKAHEVHYGKWYGRFGGFFAPDRKAALSRQETINRIYEDFPRVPGVTVRIQGREGEERKGGSDAMHHIRLVGDDPEILRTVAAEIQPTFLMIPGVLSFVEAGQEDEGPSEMTLKVDRERASAFGVNPSVLAGTVGAAVRGDTLPRFNNRGRQVPVRLLFEEEDRAGLDDVRNFQVRAEDGRMATVGEVTRTAFLRNEDNAIKRQDKKVEQWFGIRLRPGPEVWKVKRAIEAAKAMIDLPDGVSFEEPPQAFKEDDRRQARTMILLAIVFVYMLMAFFFESLLVPLSIILTVPLAWMGGVVVLRVTDTYIDQMVYTGGLLLIGIVVNNAIVLVDYAGQLRAGGMERSEALLTATRHRFRPIVMTALTTLFGMVPLTFGEADGSEFNFRSFGLVLIGGMVSSTLFTLVVVPVFYTLIEDGRRLLVGAMAPRSG